jgi:hypothetical protein
MKDSRLFMFFEMDHNFLPQVISFRGEVGFHPKKGKIPLLIYRISPRISIRKFDGHRPKRSPAEGMTHQLLFQSLNDRKVLVKKI